MARPLRVLIIEDSEDDTLLLLRELKRSGYEVEFERVDTAQAMRSVLNQKTWDLILSDYSMPEFNAPTALELLKASGLDLPFIIVSGTIGEETAVAALKAGANDFLVKGKFSRLGPAIERELREAESRNERRRAEEQLRYQAHLLSNVRDAIIASDEEYRVTYWNRAAELLYGWSPEETIGRLGPEITQTEFPNANSDEMRRRIRETGFWRGEVTQVKKDGTRFPCEISSLLLRDEKGQVTGYVSINHDITERKRAEEDLRRRELEFRSLADNIPDIVARFDPQLRHIYINDVIEQITGKPAESFIGKTNRELDLPTTPVRLWEESLRRVFESGQAMTIEFEFPSLVGLRYFESRLVPELGLTGEVEMVLSIARDITERKQAEGQTQLQIQRLRALRAIDVAISSSFNLNLTLNILLDQVTTQLNVDAAAILLFDSIARGLEYGASRGFRTSAIREAKVRLGEGYAGKAVLERHMIHVSNLAKKGDELPQAFLQMIREEGFIEYYCVPLIVKGEAKGVLEIFHRSVLAADHEWMDFLETLAGQAAIAIEDSTLFENLQRSNQELFQAYDATIEGWSHALDLRDRETEGHTLRVTELSSDLARHFDFTDEQLIYVRWGALLHDIGKMGVPDSILLKPDKLTSEEWEIMKRHPTFAFEMLSPIAYLKSAIDIPYSHHEKWDGTGYPRGLKAEVIPLAARLFAVVDVWDAVTSDRPYRKAWTREEAAQYIREQSGKHFDPHVVNVFLNRVARA